MGKKLEPSEQLLARLQDRHGRKWRAAFDKLNQKIYNIKSGLLRRGDEHDLDDAVDLESIRQKVYNAYGKPCIYCHEELDVYTMGMDHVVPLETGGSNQLGNLQVICQRCNTRKGPLHHNEFQQVLRLVHTFRPDAQKYVLRKLAKGDY